MLLKNLIWLDLEMTGLEPEKDKILEIAVVITDTNLKLVAKGPDIAIFQEEGVINNMNSWSAKQHGLSGLTEKVRNSKITCAMAEKQVLRFLAEHVDSGVSPICGNSVHQDRMFLRRYMPKLEKYFHYRNFDISSLKIAAQLWNPDLLAEVKKQESHTAMADTIDSINEMAFYRDNFLLRS